MIQRTASVTSCARNPGGEASREGKSTNWLATGTVERYGFEMRWKAEKREDAESWNISLDTQDFSSDGEDFEQYHSDIVLDDGYDWKTDVEAVLAPYPPQTVST